MNIEEKEEADEPGDCVQWAENSRSDEDDLADPALGEETEIERVPSLSELLHGWNI